MALEDLYVSSPEAAVRALVSAPPGESSKVDDQPPPRLADGIELIGEFEDSGFKKPPFIARRRDGQVVQMPKPLYQLAEEIDGRSSLDQIAARFSHTIRRQVRARDVRAAGAVHSHQRFISAGCVSHCQSLESRVAV